MRDHSLFNSVMWHQFSEGIVQQARNEASQLTKSQFEANSVEQIVDHITSTYELEPLELHVAEKDQDIVEANMDVTGNFDYIPAFSGGRTEVPAYRVIVHVPYSGSESLFSVSPSTHSLHRFTAEIFGGKLSFSKEFAQSSTTAEGIEQAINSEIAMYQTEVGRINNDLSGFNDRLRSAVEGAVESRYQQITKLDSIKTALKIPLEKTSNPSPLNQVKVTVKKIAPLSTKKENPGAYISNEDYAHILDSLRSAGASMETNRASEFQDEEALRDVMLVVLSGAITNGVAGGELFHKNGKTDISIPFENKATFVAECKLWKGAQYINEGIGQLLGYTTWRDAKTALVIFNKDNANFSAIQSQIEGMFTSRTDYVKTIRQRDGEWRFVLTKPDDAGRQIEVHVLLFDLFSSK
ncbi:MAG TPA: hypothetical protein VFT53_02970 [Candidatus Saccharimonadales bacterium]|nr:hypothetical protein [Candidatus Saccharimonadales bacterium]